MRGERGKKVTRKETLPATLTSSPTYQQRSSGRLLLVALLAYFLASGVFVAGSSLLYRVGSCATILAIALALFVKRDTVGYAKLSIVVACTASQQIGFFFVLLTLLLFREQFILARVPGLKPIRALAALGLGSYLLNQFVELNILSYPLFLLSFFLPIAFYELFHQAAGSQGGTGVLKFFFQVLTILMAVVLVQATLHRNESADWRTGGTLHAHMVGILICVGFILALSRHFWSRARRSDVTLAERIVLLSGLPVVFIVDAKYILVVMLIALAAVVVIYLTFRPRRLFPLGAAVALLFTSVIVGRQRLLDVPLVLSSSGFGEVTTTPRTLLDGFWITPRGQILSATLYLFREEPQVFLIGSGPGTFLSRASNSRAYDTMQKNEFDQVGGGNREVTSKLPVIIPPLTSWITKKYALDVIHWSTFEELPWQSGLARWPSSVTSVVWEFGIFGAGLLFLFYARLVAKGLGPRLGVNGTRWAGVALAILALFLMLVAYFDLWLEVPQFALLHWGVLGFLVRVTDKRPPEISGL